MSTDQRTAKDLPGQVYEVLSLLSVCRATTEAMENSPEQAANLACDVRATLELATDKLGNIIDALEIAGRPDRATLDKDKAA